MSILLKTDQNKHLIVASGISGLGFILIYISSLWGIGVSADSMQYIGSANNLDSLQGLFKLPSHWPPGYPLLLSFAHLFTDNILTSTRLLQASIFAFNIFLLTLISAQLLKSNSLVTCFASLLFIFSPDVYLIHFFVWSEGPFIFFQLLSFLLLIKYFNSKNQYYLYISASLAAVALMFRYAGVAYIGAISLFILISLDTKFIQRLWTSIQYTLLGLGPFLAWIGLNHFIRGEVVNREFVVHLVSLEQLQLLVTLFFSWFGRSFGVAYPIVFSLLFSACCFLIYTKRRLLPNTYFTMLFLAIVYSFIYIVFIIFSKSFVDSYIPFDYRIFVPVHVFLFLTISLVISSVFLIKKNNWLYIALMAFGFILYNNIQAMIPILNANIQQGSGYLSQYTYSLQDLTKLEILQGKTIYSNAADLIQLQAGLPAHGYPRRFKTTTLETNSDYEDELDRVKIEILNGDAILVHYYAFEWRAFFPNRAELLEKGFNPVVEFKDILILDFK